MTCRARMEKTLLCIVLGRRWGHSPGKEIRHLPRGEVCCIHIAFVVPVNTQRGNWTQEWNLSRCGYGLLALLSGAASRTSNVALSDTHHCLQVLKESQRTLNKQQYLSLPVLAGLPSLQWHYSSLCGPFKTQLLSANYFQILVSTDSFIFFWLLKSF